VDRHLHRHRRPQLAELEISRSEQRFARIFQSSLVAIGIAEVGSGS
jgi:hypothetical protein